MNASQISDIEDYCRDLPKTHTWKDLSIPPTEIEVLERMVPDYISRLEAGVAPEKAKTQIQQKYHRSIKPPHFNRIYQRLRAAGTLAKSPAFEASMISKACRGLSGVSVITVFLSPYPNGQKFSCKWNCNYCPNEPGQPRSYLFGEPGVLRANQLGFDCVEQMRVRIDSYRVNGHPTDKFEVLVLGGTLHSYPRDYLDTFMRDIYYGANTCSIAGSEVKRPAGSLEEEQELNAAGDHKVIGLTVETRPDCVTPAVLTELRRWGVTRVQLGVQHTDDAILKAVNRGCSHRHTVAALALLRDNCFKVDIHIMPNLPTSTPDKDRAMMDVVLSELQPDQVKVYPCETTPFTKILEDYKAGTYVPYSNEELKEVVIYWKTHVSPWIRNNRIVRDIPNYYIVAGVPSSSERCVYQEEMKRRGLTCRCIRCREVGRQPAPEEVGAGQLVIRRYKAAAGEELFLSWVSQDSTTLYGFCRLRLPPPPSANPFPELKGLALIRELHVYGRTLATGDADDASRGGAPVAQHTGLGRRLLETAEWLAWTNGFSGTAVIAGIGTRGYYSRFGYLLDQGAGRFMIKRWTPLWISAGLSLIFLFLVGLGLMFWHLNSSPL